MIWVCLKNVVLSTLDFANLCTVSLGWVPLLVENHHYFGYPLQLTNERPHGLLIGGGRNIEQL